MTIRQDEWEKLCAAVASGDLAEEEVIGWMHRHGWPGHTRIECWQWGDVQYLYWLERHVGDSEKIAAEYAELRALNRGEQP